MALSHKKLSLWMLAWPIFIELFLQFLLGAADTLMVSRISDDAVAVVGFSNQLFQALTTLFITVASGAGILIAQKIGSRNNEDARTIAIMAVNVSGIIGLGLSVLLFLIPGEIASMLQLPEQLIPMAKTYISIVGGGMVLIALMSALSTAIRNTGNTKGPMYTAIGMNVVHVFFNYAFIFGAFGFPKWGLMGVAISTVLCRLLATIVLFIMFLSSFERTISLRDLNVFNRKLFGDIVRIGWPLGVNMSCWVFTQLLIFTFLAMLGSNELAARTYMNTLESFCFMLGYSIALAVQIQIAHLFGAGRLREAYGLAFRAMWIGLAIVTVNAFIIFMFGKQLLGIFTDNKEIITLGVSLLGMNLLLQPGKMVNMALGNSLNAVGDTRFTMWTSVFSMWLVATGLAYFVGIELGWGLIGIYACMILDEYIRGTLSLIRWRGKKFLRKAERHEADAKAIAADGTGGAMHKASVLDA
ncbi:MATE family efflux transporter [Paenibacillus sp. FSL H8-0548]|uniref:MATE family efflux transporter n=1 Tax=Paenibacillus sp. FSL H8-0548 TaxID=1920422 RepID=UPI00096D05A7|nr:MATE family efflux transporter [Paenibacillus sp. FSL H8-0548]OMF32621.1 MATE family efflux transporter [Paenibacillus sp. FSL H8-0548]